MDYTNAKVLGECKPCGIGNYCPLGSSSVTQCPIGYFNDYNATTDTCSICPAGKYCPTVGTTTPYVCVVGKYSDVGASVCTYCEPGYYCYLEGTSIYEKINNICPSGVFCSRNLNAYADTDANTGVSTTVTGTFGLSTFPNLRDNFCPEGYYCPAGTTSIIACPIGTYNRLRGRKTLLDCQQVEGGYYVNITASITWNGVCSPGYYCPAGSTSPQQIQCPLGTFRSLSQGS